MHEILKTTNLIKEKPEWEIYGFLGMHPMPPSVSN